MYSLGIMLFEMCYQPVVGMERAQVVEGLRQKQPVLPKDFDSTEKVRLTVVFEREFMLYLSHVYLSHV